MGKLTTSFVWSFLEQGSTKLVALIVQILLARILGPEAFGILAILLVVTNIADSIAQSGLGLALIQRKNADDKAYTTAFWLSLAIAVVLYAIVFLTAPALAAFYHMNELASYLRIIAIVVFFNSMNSIQRSYLQRAFDFQQLFCVNMFAVFASGIIGVASAYFGFGIWALVAQTLSQSVLTCVAMVVAVPWKPTAHFSMDEARELFEYGWKICITGVLGVLNTGVSELIIGKACSASDLGYYSNGRKYPIAAIGVMTHAISNVLFPALSSIKNDAAALRMGLQRMLNLGTFIIAPISLLFAVLAEPIVVLLLTDEWLPCVAIFQLTFISNSLLMFQLVNLRAYMALGDSGLYMKLQVIKVIGGGIAICATAILTANIYATAFATCLTGIISILVVDMQPAKRVHGYGRLQQLKDQAPTYILAIIASTAACAISFLDMPYVPELIIQTVVFSAVYLGGARLFHMKAPNEMLDILKRMKG